VINAYEDMSQLPDLGF